MMLRVLRTLLVAPFWLLAVGCSRPAAPVDEEELPPAAVHTAQVEESVGERKQAVAGTVRPVDRALVAARVAGTVAKADVAVGQAVRAGDALITLSANELQARVEQASAALSQATSDHAREAALLAKGASTADLVRSMEDRRRITRSQLEEASAMLGYARIVAPFDGVITGDYVNPGDLAMPGTPLFEIEGTHRLRVEVQVPESLGALPVGAEMVIELETGPATGRLAELSSSADPQSRTRLAKIDLPPGETARSGQFVRVRWPAGKIRTLTVPREAISLFGQMERVYVIEGGRARLRLVKTGAVDAGRVQILAGLDAGETVIIHPPASLRDGQRVEVGQ